MTLAEITAVYRGSSGDATKAMYAKMEAFGPHGSFDWQIGSIAVNLFRACKTSERAKKYRKGPGHISASYERKDWSVGNAATILTTMEPEPPFPWGWGIDEEMRKKGDPHHHIVYFDLPTGQISFHVGARGPGPAYPGQWDRAVGTAPDRICQWCADLFAAVANKRALAGVEPIDVYNGEGL